AGYDPSLIEIFDIDIAIAKSSQHLSGMISEIRSHIEHLRLKPALEFKVLKSLQTALVVGGGIVGMYSALSLAEGGAVVHIVERADKLGGYAGTEVTATIDGLEPTKIASDLIQQISDNSQITVHLNSEIISSHGLPGNYDTQIKEDNNGLFLSIDHAVTIFATGNGKSQTTEYQYGQSDKVLTHGELGVGLRSGDIDASDMDDVVMIQCVGSREKETHEYCSRICCMGAIFNALLIKEKNPDARIFVLFRDIMTYGSFERYYTEARTKGVIFVEYDLDNKPKVEIEDGKPVVTFKDKVLDAEIELPVDMLALATGIEADQSNQKLAEIYGVDLNEDGFFIEADAKWRPIEFQKLGTYVVGVAHSPMTLKESIMQAEAAVQKSHTYLSGREIQLAREISVTHDANCVRCKRCIDICPYHARSYDADEKCIVIDSATCQACGMCATACRNSAAEVKGWSSKQMMAVIDAKLMDYNISATTE
ncbi:MAG: CoB--CoM heterodisulfide reductase iron-sulfur subunit A family protein, partial [Deltaproteobacteria bacterium]|nr:CoB--CoM heterodisulfide reductase iron-sulfur subunit A family protein [Deltaproteobacteria bacterium]